MARLSSLFLLSFASFSFANVLPRTQSFIDHELVPDVLSTAPLSVLYATFPGGVEILEGNVVTLEAVSGVPTLDWNAKPDKLYTVMMCDADAPSREEPYARSYLHWLVVNVPGDDVSAGHIAVPFLNSNPGPETGLHRYVFLVFEQPGVISTEGLPDATFEGRFGFNVENFAKQYDIGVPIAGNFYQTENVED